MNIKVQMKPGAIKKLVDGERKAALLVAEQMRHEIITDGVIPFDTGNMQNVQTDVDPSEINKGIAKIYHDTPYARRLYYHPEYDFQKTWNSNARGEWWSEWLEGAKKPRPAKLFAKLYKKVSGGYVK